MWQLLISYHLHSVINISITFIIFIYKWRIKMKIFFLSSIILSISFFNTAANAASSSFGNCTSGIVDPNLPTSTTIVTSPGQWSLVMIDGLYCGIFDTTPGETALIRSMALQARDSGNTFVMFLNATSKNLETYTVLP